MSKIVCYDYYGNVIKQLTQWDVNRSMYIPNWQYDVAPIIQFTNRPQTENYSVASTYDEINDVVSFEVPNALLRNDDTVILFIGIPRKISNREIFFDNALPSLSEGDENTDYYIGSDGNGYSYYIFSDDDYQYNLIESNIQKTQTQIALEHEAASFECQTTFKFEFPIIRRLKPSDYQYTDDESVISIESLREEFMDGLAELEEIAASLPANFIVNYHKINGSYQPDKSFDAIRRAYLRGDKITAIVENYKNNPQVAFQLLTVNTNANIIVFSCAAADLTASILHLVNDSVILQETDLSQILQIINSKLSTNQGSANVGKTMIVGSDGNLSAQSSVFYVEYTLNPDTEEWESNHSLAEMVSAYNSGREIKAILPDYDDYVNAVCSLVDVDTSTVGDEGFVFEMSHSDKKVMVFHDSAEISVEIVDDDLTKKVDKAYGTSNRYKLLRTNNLGNVDLATMATGTGTSTNIPMTQKAVTDALATKQDLIDYSTEKVIGTWINGKPLYQKSFSITLPDNVNASNTGIDCTGIDDVVKIEGTINCNGYHYSFNGSWYRTSNERVALYYRKTNPQINAYAGNTFLNMPCVVTVQYTKTTDTANS